MKTKFLFCLIVSIIPMFCNGCLKLQIKSNEKFPVQRQESLLGCWEIYKACDNGVEYIAKEPLSSRLALVKANKAGGYAVAHPYDDGYVAMKAFTIETKNGKFLCYKFDGNDEKDQFFINRYELINEMKTLIVFEDNSIVLQKLLDKKIIDGDLGTLMAGDLSSLTKILENHGEQIFSGKQLLYRKVTEIPSVEPPSFPQTDNP